jgi:hypothetical protein
MTRVSVTTEETAFIRERIERFPIEGPPNLQWQLPHMRAHTALPLYVGWTETAGIQPDGTLVRWSTEGEWPGVRELKEKTWVNLALVQGAARYPELKRLIPSRPDSAVTCDACKGVGRFPPMPEIICECGGVGWVAG